VQEEQMLNRLELLFSINVTGLKKSVIRELLKLTQKPEIISFAGGLPCPGTFPVQQTAELTKELIASNGSEILQYSTTEGDPQLKEAIIEFMAKDQIKVSADQILITSGAQQGLDLIGKVFVNRHNPVIIGRPSYVGAIGAFRSYAAHFIGIDLDDQGLRMDQLMQCLHRMRLEGNLPKFIYTVPDFQNPAGVTLSLERRRKLLDMAREYQVLVVEDTPYRHLRYVNESIPTLYQLDEGGGYVISIHTFSKILFPGLRLGWIMASPLILEKFIIAKQSMDLCTSALSQAIAYEFFRRDWMDSHIQENVELYRRKRQVMLQSLETHMPEHPDICWTRPEGGLFLWVTLPDSLDVDHLFYQALEENVAYVAGSGFYTDDGGRTSMRLNFSYPSEEEIEEGVKRLSRVIQRNLDN
jgi:2-aminoadipate transaminase